MIEDHEEPHSLTDANVKPAPMTLVHAIGTSPHHLGTPTGKITKVEYPECALRADASLPGKGGRSPYRPTNLVGACVIREHHVDRSNVGARPAAGKESDAAHCDETVEDNKVEAVKGSRDLKEPEKKVPLLELDTRGELGAKHTTVNGVFKES